MRNLLLLIIPILYSNLTAQTTLTAANNPTPGDIILEVDCDTNGVAEGNPGANRTWNFTNIILQDSISQTWVNASATPYTALFPTSNLSFTNNTAFAYATTSLSEYVLNGFAEPGTLLSYSNPQTVMKYPFTYGNSFQDDFAFTWIDSGNFIAGGSGNIKASCDAWGTLILPSGSYANSIRVKYISYTEPASKMNYSSGADLTYDTAYFWYVPGKKDWVFIIDYTYNYDSVLAGFTREKSVSYYPNRPAIGITQLSSLVTDDFHLNQNYPNPFNPTTKIRFDIAPVNDKPSAEVKLIIYDALGREVETLVKSLLQRGTYEVNWKAGSYAGGVYFYKLIAGNFEQTRSMILLK